VDGRDIKFSNITDVSESSPICIENIKVHILVRGNGYLLKERKFLPEVKNIDYLVATT
jgi:cyanophycinase